MQSHIEMTLMEGIVWSLCRATADLVWYLGLQGPVSEIINKLELIYGTMASFDILMQKFYKLQQGKTGKGTSICNPLVVGAECSSVRIPYNVECRWSPEAPEREFP